MDNKYIFVKFDTDNDGYPLMEKNIMDMISNDIRKHMLDKVIIPYWGASLHMIENDAFVEIKTLEELKSLLD